jgi:hypothetical protein
VITNTLLEEGKPDCLALACGQPQTGAPLDPRDRLGGVDGWPGRPGRHENPQSLGDGLLGPVQASEEHTATTVQQVCHDVAGLQLQCQGRCDQVIGNLQQPGGRGRQLLHR